MKNTLFFLILLGFIIPKIATAQKPRIVYVTAKSGLNYRDKPDLHSEKLGKFDFGTRLAVVEETDISLEVVDNGRKVKGQWLKVETQEFFYYWSEKLKDKSGYVFSGFLVDSVNADFTKIPRLVMRDNINFPSFFAENSKAQVSFSEQIISAKTYQNYASKYHNKIEIDQSILESTKSEQSFLIKTGKSIYRFVSADYYNSSYYYDGFIKEYNVYILAHVFSGTSETFFLDKAKEIKLYFPQEGDGGPAGPFLSPNNRQMLFSGSHGLFTDGFSSTIYLYDFPNKNSIEGAQIIGIYSNEDWSINEIVWIDNHSFAAKGYQRVKGSNKDIYQYFKVIIK